MNSDIIDLRSFYASLIGRLAERAIAMALSSVSVVANSLRLRGFDARRPVHSGDASAPAREDGLA